MPSIEDLLNDMQQIKIPFVNFEKLKQFNQAKANYLSNEILKNDFDANTWFENYQKKLLEHLIADLQLINNKTFEKPWYEIGETFDNASGYFKSTRPVQCISELLPDAHATIQATGAATQNENSWFALFDFINYFRYGSSIAKTKKTSLSLLAPFEVILNEYQIIGATEQNVFLKCFRTLMPILITLACVSFIAYLLIPLLLPEVILLALFIPELFIGLAVASLYITTKNYVYDFLYNFLYDFLYDTCYGYKPGFDVNERILTAFKSEQNATDIQSFYLKALESCKAREKEYISRQHILTDEELKSQEKNNQTKKDLKSEWDEFHHGKKGINLLLAIAIDRINSECQAEYQQLKLAIKKESPYIKKSISDATNIIKTRFTEKSTTTNTTQLTQFSFFKPEASLKIKDEIKKMDDLKTRLAL
ncbi:MAG: hypothetical protein QNK11_09525 [Legionella sp.]|nr:hypothetical protein [Legionella sp.]